MWNRAEIAAALGRAPLFSALDASVREGIAPHPGRPSMSRVNSRNGYRERQWNSALPLVHWPVVERHGIYRDEFRQRALRGRNVP